MPAQANPFRVESKKDESYDSPIEIHCHARPLLSVPDYKTIAQKNEAGERRRLEFMEKLKAIPGGFMEAEPFHPQCYSPHDAAERRLVLEYAIVWMKTKPDDLPSHYFESLSFEIKGEWRVILDEAKNKEHERILAALDTILTPYAPKK
jgi:hypothetical protein